MRLSFNEIRARAVRFAKDYAGATYGKGETQTFYNDFFQIFGVQRRSVYKKSPGTGAMLCFIGHALMENRSGLIVQGDLTQADGHAERRAALDMIHRHSPGLTRQLTLGADKGFDAAGFVADLRQACVTPHVAQKVRYSAVDGRTTRHEGYAKPQRNRKRIEEAFGWAKTVGGMAQTVYRGIERVRSRFILTMAANNLARLPRLLAA